VSFELENYDPETASEAQKRFVSDHLGKEEDVNEAVHHPSHYNVGRIEVIDMIEDQGMAQGFCLGNAIKYIMRAGKKDPRKTIEDLEKAAWYLARYISHLKQKDPKL
jgi:hypothetical protein